MNSSKGLFPWLFALTVRFRMWTAVAKALTQYFFGSFAWMSKYRPISTRVRLKRSATPFCCGVSGTVNSCFILESLQYSLNFLEVFSAPLSVRKRLGVPLFEFVEDLRLVTHILYNCVFCILINKRDCVF